ncbi:MAG: acyltransferase family protein [Candidatus Aminicenantaceae bacterium]
MKSDRLTSLDAFRGFTIAGMILVNNPGSWKHVYAPLRHAEWHGWTPTDLVFPFFLFIVGVSVSLSFSKRVSIGYEKYSLYFKIMKRTLILFSLGIILALIPRFDLTTLRIPGVLQRIALCYLFSSLLFLKTGTKGRFILAFSLLAIYWIIMKIVPVPGYEAGNLDYHGNLCAYIDNKLLSGHLYKADFDPEGILSTLPAISTTLLGTLTGDLLRSSKRILQKTSGLLGAGLILALAGLLLHPLFPINKQLWTSTFVLFSAGAALICLAAFYVIMEGMGIRKWAVPFLIFGTNAITVYVASSIMAKLAVLIKVSAGSQALSLKTYIYKYIFVPLGGSLNGSLMFPLFLLLIWLGIMIPLYKKKIFIKI